MNLNLSSQEKQILIEKYVNNGYSLKKAIKQVDKIINEIKIIKNTKITLENELINKEINFKDNFRKLNKIYS